MHFVLPGTWVDEVERWCFDKSRRVGDVAIIKNSYGYSVCYYSDAIANGSFAGYWTQKTLDEQYENGEITQREYEAFQKALLCANTAQEYAVLKVVFLNR